MTHKDIEGVEADLAKVIASDEPLVHKLFAVRTALTTILHTTPTVGKDIEGWEKEFDEMISTGWMPNNEVTKTQYLESIADIKKFINTTLRHTWLQQEIEVLEGMKYTKEQGIDAEMASHNEALQEIITRHQEELNQK